MKKQCLSLLLTLSLLLGLSPAWVLASGAMEPPFTATADGAALTEISVTESGYATYTYDENWNMVEDGAVTLYTVTVPAGTETVSLVFAENVLAYNYDGNGNYLSGSYDDIYSGVTEADVPLDANADGVPDYVQVQTPYDESWNSDVLYAITFQSDDADSGAAKPPFTATVDDAALTEISVTESGYATYAYDENWNMVEDGAVTLYTVTVPAGTETVSLVFAENVLAYNYDGNGNYLSGSYDDIYSGVTEADVPLDANADGVPDYVQVQTPYDESWNSDVLYAITFCSDDADSGAAEPDGTALTCAELAEQIAAAYAETDAGSDSNTPWIAADLAAYAALTGTDGLSNAQKQLAADYAIGLLATENASVSDLAKAVLCLVALGDDPAQITDADGVSRDGVSLLRSAALTDGTVNDAAQSAYILPWVIVALAQFGESYDAEITALTAALLEAAHSGGSWGYRSGDTDYFDADATAFALFALAFAPESAEKSAAVEAAMAALRANVTLSESGAVSAWGAESAETTAQLIVALTAMNEDPATFFASGDLTAGLLSMQDESGSGFTYMGGLNATATEQGFRGLIALLGGAGYRLYDFSGQTLSAVEASRGSVRFVTVPADAVVTVTAEETVFESVGGGWYDLPAGDYSYRVALDGYSTKTGSITVADGAAAQTVYVSLSRASSTGGGTESDTDTVTVTVQVLAHDAETCGNALTYKQDAAQFYSLLNTAEYSVTLTSGVGTARDALVAALDESALDYTELSNGYFSSIAGYAEMEHGANSGWLYIVNGKMPSTAAGNTVFSKDSTMIWFYTDDYTTDYSAAGNSSSGSSGSNGGSSANSSGSSAMTADTEDADATPQFDDVGGHWAEDAILSGAVLGLFAGTEDGAFSPEAAMSRAMLATVLYRMAEGAAPETEDAAFSDVPKGAWYYEAVQWAAANGVADGNGTGAFSPDAPVTREQLVSLLWRYAAVQGLDTETSDGYATAFPDGADVSAWADDAMAWAVGAALIVGRDDGTLDPAAAVTRAETAVVIQRFLTWAAL
ncbi:MAG: S-layer homology domain-containing protein [Oscillospiraceae bacterium]|nr:S-layer homology domain-containing protein [Oscillospiraceae bacterium]